MPPRNGDSGLCISPGLFEKPLLAKARRDLRHGAQKEGCHDRCFQQGLGSAVRRQTDLWSLVREGVGLAHQLPRNASSVPGLSIHHARHTGAPCASMLRQQVCGVIHKLILIAPPPPPSPLWRNQPWCQSYFSCSKQPHGRSP